MFYRCGLIAFAVVAGVPHAVRAEELSVEIEIRSSVSTVYHRPYIAVWIERPADQAMIGSLAVWYDVRMPKGLGATWLGNLRTWWRKGGQSLTLPADGVSGATRGPGRHRLGFDDSRGVLARLEPGAYEIVVEAAREQGGRERVRTPFVWGGRGDAARSSGTAELGAVVVSTRR